MTHLQAIATTSERVDIEVTTREDSTVRETAAQLARLPRIYVMSRQLVRAGVDTDTGAPVVEPFPPEVMRTDLAGVCRFFKMAANKRGAGLVQSETHPPDWLTKSVHKLGDWPGVRPLLGVSSTPVLRPDGSIWQTPGYDKVTRYLYIPNAAYQPIPERPTQGDACQALAGLLEPFQDFPFASESDRYAAVALLLTILARPAIDGPVPMALVEANMRGTGKSLVVDTAALIATGKRAARSEFTAANEEMGKRLHSAAAAGARFMLLDNISEPIGGATLDAVLTGVVVQFRVLGKSESKIVPWSAVLAATANNPILKGDTARRVYRVRLESSAENPENRTDLHHSPLLPWVAQERVRLVRQAYTLLRAHAIAERPTSVKPWGSFESWSRVIADAIVWAGGEDPQATRASIEAESDEGVGALDGLLLWFEQTFPDGPKRATKDGFTSATTVKGLIEASDKNEALGEALAALLGGKRMDTASVGYALRSIARRHRKGRYLYSEVKSGCRTWKVSSVDVENKGR